MHAYAYIPHLSQCTSQADTHTHTQRHTHTFACVFNTNAHAHKHICIYIQLIHPCIHTHAYHTCRSGCHQQDASASHLRAPCVPPFQKFWRTVYFLFRISKHSEILENLPHIADSAGSLCIIFTSTPCTSFSEILENCVIHFFRNAE